MAIKAAKKEIGLMEAVNIFCQDKALDRDSVMNIIKDSLTLAYKKKLGVEQEKDSSIHVEFSHEKSGDVIISIEKQIIENSTSESDSTHPLHITIDEARKIDSSATVGSRILVIEKPMDLSRIVYSQARQMIFQRLRDMEKEILFQEYKQKEGELTHGYFQRWKRDIMLIDLGKIEGIMPKREQNPGEKYRQGDRMKAIIQKVELRPKEPIPVITLSRASGDFVKKLFEMEIPEIYDGIVEIRNVARIPAVRTKVVVHATRSDIDPVGACVGMKGVRIQSIVRELGNERVDIVEFSEDPAQFISNAISPAKPIEVHADRKRGDALVIVPEESLSLAIGVNGSNVKLASQLSGFKIDIKTVNQYNQELASPEAREKLDRLFNAQAEADSANNMEESDLTPLSEIPGLTPRVIDLLLAGGIQDVETLIEISPEDLASISGIGPTTAEHILKLLQESIEWVED